MPKSTTKFTAERCARIVEHCRGGLFRYNACELEGVGVRTLERWVALGRDNLDTIEREDEDPAHEGPRTRLSKHGRFLVALLAAEAQAEREILGVVHQLARKCTDAPTKLRAATWYLERKNNLRYGRGALRVKVEGDGDEPEQDVTDTVMAKLSQIERRIRPTDGGTEAH